MKTKDYSSGEREFETGKDEAWSSAMLNLYNNMKRTYDEYQDLGLAQNRDLHAHIMKVLTDSQADTISKRAISDQALQNAVETANFISKRALSTFDRQDLGFNKQLNLDAEEATAIRDVQSNEFKEAIKAAVAEAVLLAVPQKK